MRNRLLAVLLALGFGLLAIGTLLVAKETSGPIIQKTPGNLESASAPRDAQEPARPEGRLHSDAATPPYKESARPQRSHEVNDVVHPVY